jgi:hypothetical protein
MLVAYSVFMAATLPNLLHIGSSIFYRFSILEVIIDALDCLMVSVKQCLCGTSTSSAFRNPLFLFRFTIVRVRVLRLQVLCLVKYPLQFQQLSGHMQSLNRYIGFGSFVKVRIGTAGSSASGRSSSLVCIVNPDNSRVASTNIQSSYIWPSVALEFKVHWDTEEAAAVD